MWRIAHASHTGNPLLARLAGLEDREVPAREAACRRALALRESSSVVCGSFWLGDRQDRAIERERFGISRENSNQPLPVGRARWTRARHPAIQRAGVTSVSHRENTIAKYPNTVSRTPEMA